MNSNTASTKPKSSALYPHKWWILSAVSIVSFMGSVDGSIANMALPTLMKELSTDFATAQWVLLAYLVGLTMMMISMGRLADLLGKKPIFVAGLTLFMLGSLLCSLSPTIYWLITFRFIESIGAAMMLPVGIAILTETWPVTERGKAIGIASGVIGFGIIFGPAVGGVVLEEFSWPWIFYVNLPIGLLAMVLILIFVPALKPEEERGNFDLLGAMIVGVGLLAFTLALTIGQAVGFTTIPILSLLALSFIAIPLFIQVEKRVHAPMVHLHLFHNIQFSLNLFTSFLAFMAIAGVVFLLPFYLELVMGLSLWNVGMMMAIAPLMMGVLQPFTGTISDRLGTRPVIVLGLILQVVGYIAASTLPADGTQAGFILRLLPIVVGISTFHSPNNSAIMGAVPRQHLGVASGILSMTRSLGQVTSIALLGAFFSSRLHLYGDVQKGIRAMAPETIVLALRDQFLLVAGLIGVGLVATLWAFKYDDSE